MSEIEKVVMPAEPPAELSTHLMRGDTDDAKTLGDRLFDLCREDDYAGLYRELVKRYGASFDREV